MDYVIGKEMTVKSKPSIKITIESDSHKITFDNQSGILTLKHKDDKLNEDIQINMSMNFGNF